MEKYYAPYRIFIWRTYYAGCNGVLRIPNIDNSTECDELYVSCHNYYLSTVYGNILGGKFFFR